MFRVYKVASFVAIIAAVSVMVAGSAIAQQPGQGKGRGQGGGVGRGMGMMGGGQLGATLLANAEVQKDLGLSDEQKKKAAELSEKIRGEVGSTQELANLSPAERQERFREIGQKMAAASEKYQPQIDELLQPEQRQRLKQISLQAAGASALLRPEVAELLAYSPEQREKLASIGRDFGQKLQDLRTPGGEGGAIQERIQKVRELNTERDQQAFAVLTADQKQKLDELKGKPFDVSQLQTGFGGFGGAGGRGKRQPM